MIQMLLNARLTENLADFTVFPYMDVHHSNGLSHG